MRLSLVAWLSRTNLLECLHRIKMWTTRASSRLLSTHSTNRLSLYFRSCISVHLPYTEWPFQAFKSKQLIPKRIIILINFQPNNFEFSNLQIILISLLRPLCRHEKVQFQVSRIKNWLNYEWFQLKIDSKVGVSFTRKGGCLVTRGIAREKQESHIRNSSPPQGFALFCVIHN